MINTNSFFVELLRALKGKAGKAVGMCGEAREIYIFLNHYIKVINDKELLFGAE